jgi:hypothetical protein
MWWIPITPLKNGWRNLGGDWAPASFYVDNTGIVHLRGQVTGGSIGTEVFTLGCDYYPHGGDQAQMTVSATQTGEVVLGEVTIRRASLEGMICTASCVTPTTGPFLSARPCERVRHGWHSARFSLDGISWRMR